jgi:hypothetical protein
MISKEEAYREVIHEDRVRIEKATKAPDYSFRLPGGKCLFFAEAKNPAKLHHLRLKTNFCQDRTNSLVYSL